MRERSVDWAMKFVKGFVSPRSGFFQAIVVFFPVGVQDDCRREAVSHEYQVH